MELWFSEQHTPNVRLSLKVDKQLFSETSEFQRVDIFDATEFGRVLVLDGRIMLTERDEFIYHEMIKKSCLSAAVTAVRRVNCSNMTRLRKLTSLRLMKLSCVPAKNLFHKLPHVWTILAWKFLSPTL